MIVVLADDLTGAGEIGGIGLAYGLTVEIQREFFSQSDAELLIIDTDTRSKSSEEAGRVVRDVACCLTRSTLSVEWMYKKTDSVLRGAVASELEALRDIMHVARVLLIPANPSKGRIIRNGNYLVDGKLLSETDFANDPEYPAVTSNVLEMPALSGGLQVHLMKSDRRPCCEGIVVGQAETMNDLLRWSEYMDEKTIMAGAGDFFEAILRNKGFSKKRGMTEKGYRLDTKALFVCGSSSDSSRQALKNAESLGMKICRMPEGLFRSHCPEDTFFRQWSEEIIGRYEYKDSAIIAIDREVVRNAEFAGKLRRSTAAIISIIFQKIPLKELVVEGGATASEIVSRFGWTRFVPCGQLAPGIVRMKVQERDNTYLTIKPGSYPWPNDIWENEIFEE